MIQRRMKSGQTAVLGIDGGGTRSLAVAVNLNGQILATAEAGSLNFFGAGLAEARQNLKRLVNSVDRQLPTKTRVTRVVVGCAALFTLSDAAVLPIVGGALTKRAGAEASLLIAACIVLPQIVVAALSPRMGSLAETHGRRIVLALGFLTLPVRALLFAIVTDPTLVVAVQILNGIASAAFLIMVPLVTADIAGRSGHFNLALGFVGFTIGIGGVSSTTVAGWVTDHYGEAVTFVFLAMVGLMATALVWFALPETKPAETKPDLAEHSTADSRQKKVRSKE